MNVDQYVVVNIFQTMPAEGHISSVLNTVQFDLQDNLSCTANLQHNSLHGQTESSSK